MLQRLYHQGNLPVPVSLFQSGQCCQRLPQRAFFRKNWRLYSHTWRYKWTSNWVAGRSKASKSPVWDVSWNDLVLEGPCVTLSPLEVFIACLTMTRVSSSSVNIFPSNPLRTVGFTYMIPLGATGTGYQRVLARFGIDILVIWSFTLGNRSGGRLRLVTPNLFSPLKADTRPKHVE